MKKIACIVLVLFLLAGCSSPSAPVETNPAATEIPAAPVTFSGTMAQDTSSAPEYVSRFDFVTEITLSDDEVLVDTLDSGAVIEDSVYGSHDIIYYEDKDTYESGNPYGEGTAADKHTAEEAETHNVVNIVKPGAYRVTGKLSAGQIRVDLGEDAREDPNAVVELILDNVDITCTVGPAVLFLNVYECDENWSVDTASADVDTSAAGANLILQGENTVTGSHVAKIFKDKEGEKKLWKQDGAIYSYMSMNVFGPGSLDLTADNEGLDTELHLTINGGNIAIRSDNDGINTNEDGVSVTTINGGNIHIIAGLGAEGDGIDSNGYLVINGGTVVASANPAADAGMDSDLGSYIHGGTVIALGSTMDWAESDSGQVTMNLQFAQYQSSGSAIVAAGPDGNVVFAYDPSEDEVLGENVRRYMGAILSCPGFVQGDSYHIYLDGTLSGEEIGGIYTSVTAYDGGAQMQYTGTDVRMGPGGMGQMPGGQRPADGQWPGESRKDLTGEDIPQGDFKNGFPEDMEIPEGVEIPEGGFDGQKPEMPEGGFDGRIPEDFTVPQGEMPQMPGGDFGGWDGIASGEGNALFYMQDMVNFFSGLTAVTQS